MNTSRANFPPPPDAEESMRIAEHIHTMAERLIDRPYKAKKMLEKWIVKQPHHIATLHLHYLAVTAPLIAAAAMRQSVTPGADEMFTLHKSEGAVSNPARDAVAQSFVRYLNDDVATAQDLIGAAIDTGGDKALFDVGIEALKLLAGVLEGVRDGLK